MKKDQNDLRFLDNKIVSEDNYKTLKEREYDPKISHIAKCMSCIKKKDELF